MSSYNGLSVAVRRPFANGLLVAANYMWSHEIDNGSNGSGDGDEISPQNPMCLACDRASGAWDARHVVNGNAVYELPFGRGKAMLNGHGVAKAIAGGWEIDDDRSGADGGSVISGQETGGMAESGALRKWPESISRFPDPRVMSTAYSLLLPWRWYSR